MRELRNWAGQAIFGNTLNLLACTIVVMASLLTGDLRLLGIAGVCEVSYLGLAFRSSRFAARVAWQEDLSKDPLADNDPLLDRLLLMVAVAGFVTMVFFGFGKHLLNHPWPDLTHAAGWEAGAIAWTGMFAFYYVCKFGRFKKQWNVFIGLSVAVVIGLCLWKAYSTMYDPLAHVSWIGGIVILLAISDGYLALEHTNDRERRLSRASFWWADVPTVAAVLTLWAYLVIHPDAESRDVFVSGVIACQLLFSNAVFIVMEFEVFGSPAAAPKGTGGSPTAVAPETVGPVSGRA